MKKFGWYETYVHLRHDHNYKTQWSYKHTCTMGGRGDGLIPKSTPPYHRQHFLHNCGMKSGWYIDTYIYVFHHDPYCHFFHFHEYYHPCADKNQVYATI